MPRRPRSMIGRQEEMMDEPKTKGYLEDGPFADPKTFRSMLETIVRELGPAPSPRALAERIRGLMVHVFWQSAYGLTEDRERSVAETNLRTMEEKLAWIAAAEQSLGRKVGSAEPLPPERKLIGNCRDYSLFFAALLREAGTPARARCGFGMYFIPGRGEDHWVVERWDENDKRWAISDPQLDEIMIDKLKIGFDPMDLPDGAFLSGGEAWLACRNGDDPGRYGIFGMKGWDFVKGDFVRDLAALDDLVLLPWDLWGIMERPYVLLGESDIAALDAAARASPMRARMGRSEAAALCADPRFALPRRITTYLSDSPKTVDLGPILGLGWPDGSERRP